MDKALARYFYQIKISPDLFNEAKGGQIKCIHDAPIPAGKKAVGKVIRPAWFIWMSDSPF